MYRNSLFDNPFVIFLLLCIIAFTNVILPVHYISIFLVGVLYVAMSRAIEKEYNYSLLFIVLGFSIIELSHGLKIFSVTLLSLFIYFFIAPKIKSSIASETFYFISVMSIVYIGMGLLFNFWGGIDSKLVAILIMNFVLDLLLVSILV